MTEAAGSSVRLRCRPVLIAHVEVVIDQAQPPRRQPDPRT
ncbi:hypothetical protein FB388_2268 [Pseudonocardia cypriaca]|uniref:Uncharacterized protein n=1 Tax=Pseudonocardia cypriaca TaxID=882449 RepID=A0A543GFN9_9PSEU|nr:hypothetical protein FB388_2268 [Pseudonocardia cypriaca]